MQEREDGPFEALQAYVDKERNLTREVTLNFLHL